jgi:hypothetical protein
MTSGLPLSFDFGSLREPALRMTGANLRSG